MEKNKKMRLPKIAIMDWGIGGFSFYRILRAQYAYLPIVYFSDSGVIPYGKQTRTQLRARLLKIIHFLHARGTHYLIVACNAMSTVLPHINKNDLPKNFRVSGVITQTIDTLKTQNKTRHIGVIGGIRTIKSGAYRKPFTHSTQKVSQRIAQPLSAMIESGEMKTEKFLTTILQIIKPLKKCDALVLACTHYTAASDIFAQGMPNAKIIDPCESTFRYINQKWKLKNIRESRIANVFLTTGDPIQTSESIKKAFSMNVHKFTKISTDLD